MQRCPWANTSPAMQAYHDHEWGQPVHEQQKLFELLSLETYQAGLSWQTVLNKRGAFNAVFYHYNVQRVAQMTAADVDRLLQDERIIRHRQKLAATINNARVLANWSEPVSFSTWLWAFVDDQPIRHPWQTAADVPASTSLAQTLARELKRHGFKFVGPTTVYSFLQAAGLVNDHLASCDWAPENRGRA